MRGFIAVSLGAFIGGGFSFAVAYLYIALVRRIGRRVLRSWLIFLWFPVHMVFAFIMVFGVFFPFYALGLVGAVFPLTDALKALAIGFGVVAAAPALVYYFREWHHLRKAGHSPPGGRRSALLVDMAVDLSMSKVSPWRVFASLLL